MPNNVKNKIRFKGKKEEIEEIIESFGTKAKDGFIFPDFQKIIPRPKALSIESGSIGDLGYEMLTDLAVDPVRFTRLSLDLRKKAFTLGLKYLSNMKKYGHKTWYRWSLLNWGTKWNSYDHKKQSNNAYIFYTAWSPVPNLIKLISKKFPNVEVFYEWDGNSYDCVHTKVVYKGGK